MTTVEQPRNSSVVREELSDLTGYLDNLPPAVRNSGVFKSYELRLRALNEELSLAENSENFPKEDIEINTATINLAVQIYSSLNDSGQDYLPSAEQIITYKKITKFKDNMAILDVFSEFIASLSKAQWLHLFTVFGLPMLLGLAGAMTKSKSEMINKAELLKSK